jgi:uncharacterized membrane protein YdcZ (DUF606 family)
MTSIQTIVREASLVPVHLHNINALKEALGKARDWSHKVDHVQVIHTDVQWWTLLGGGGGGGVIFESLWMIAE